MDHTKYRDFTFSYIISRFHLENIDVPFLSTNGSVVSSNGSVVYKRISYHAKGLVCCHENCFTAILFPSFFCNIRRIAPRFDWTLMERWRKTTAVVSTSMVARRAAALRLNIRWGAVNPRPPILFNRWPCGERRASADLDRGLRRSRSPSAFFASLSNLVELYRSSLLEFYRICQTLRLDFCRNLSNDFPCFPISNMW